MPLANGKLVRELVKEAQVKNLDINKTGISGDDGSGRQPHGFAAKQLLNAEKGENLSVQKLHAIAKRLGSLLDRELSAENLTLDEEETPAEAEPAPQGGKTMIAKSKKNAPAVNAEQGATVSININAPLKD